MNLLRFGDEEERSSQALPSGGGQRVQVWRPTTANRRPAEGPVRRASPLTGPSHSPETAQNPLFHAALDSVQVSDSHGN